MIYNRKLAIFVLLGSSALASPALAQSAPAAANAPAANEIVVTGSAIRTKLDQLAVPVSIVGAEDIQKAGVQSNVLDILRKSLPVFGGRSNQGASNGANNNQRTAGGCSVQLRNLDTLVLVNGRRVAIDAIIGASNGKPFVNICEIAPDAIDHIEVLADGASAIYGSDAIGGVVNIILKSNFHGIDANVRYGGADGYNERSVGLTAGFNPLEHTNITASASYTKSDPLYQNQRGFSSPFYSSSYGVPGSIGTYVLAPGVTTPAVGGGFANQTTNPQYVNVGAAVGTAINTGVTGTHDISSFDTILLQMEQKALSLSLNSDLSGGARSVELFGDLQYAQNRSYGSYAPTVIGVVVPATSPINPFTAATTVNFGSSANPVTYANNEKSFRGTLGLKGRAQWFGHAMDWELAYTHSENTLDQLISNVVYRPNVVKLGALAATPNASAAATGGYNSSCVATPGGGFSQVLSVASGTFVCQPVLNPFAIGGGLTPASLANVLTNETFHGKSKLDTFDAKLSGSLMHLPGGSVGFAIGGSWRRDAVSTVLSQNAWLHQDGTANTGLLGVNPVTGGIGVGVYNAATNPGGGDVGALLTAQNGLSLTGDPYSGSRTVTAQFLELRVPLAGEDMHLPGFYNLDLIGAVRHEHYSDAGDSTVPKIGFRWQPVERQITLRGNFAKSFTAPTLYQIGQPVNFRTVATGPITSGIPAAVISGFSGFYGEDGNNPAAKPAHAQSWSFGLVLKPDMVPHLKIDAEFSSVKETGQITGIGYNNILADVNLYGSASQFFNNVAVGGYQNIGTGNPFTTPGALLTYINNARTAGNIDSTGNLNLYVVDRPSNLGLIQIKSLTVATSYEIPTQDKGTISLQNQLSYLFSYKYQAVPGNNPANAATLIYDFAGTTTQGGGAQGTLPRLRMYTALNWDWGQWTFGVANSFIGPVTDQGTGGASYYLGVNNANPAVAATFIPGHVNSFSSWDLRLGWTSDKDRGGKGLRVTAGVNNLFNQAPPLSTNINPAAGAANGATAWRLENNTDTGTYGAGAVGRLIWVAAGYRF